MKFPNPNLLRFIRPTRLQLWCAHHGVLTGRWTYAETERIRRAAADRFHKAGKLFDPRDPGEPLPECTTCPCREDGTCGCPCYGCKFHCGACWCDPCREFERGQDAG